MRRQNQGWSEVTHFFGGRGGERGEFRIHCSVLKGIHFPLYESFVYVLIRPLDFCSLLIALGIKHNTLLVNNSINKPVANRLFGENSFLVKTLGYPWKTFGGNYDIVEFISSETDSPVLKQRSILFPSLALISSLSNQ